MNKMNRKAAFTELLKLASDCGCGDSKTSRFEEGVSADPTENMSEEDADTWWEKHDQNKDNFKTAGGGAGVTLLLSGKGKNIRAQKPDVSGWHPVGLQGVRGIRIPVENLTLQSYEDAASVHQAGVLTLESSELPVGYDSSFSVTEMDNVTLSAGFSRGRAPTEVDVTGTLEDDEGYEYGFEGTLMTSPAFREAWDSLDSYEDDGGYRSRRFANTSKTSAASIQPLIKRFETASNELEKAIDLLSALGKEADKAWGEAENAFLEGQKTFEENGEHPDDFTSTPEGKKLQHALEVAEDLAKATVGNGNSDLLRSLKSCQDDMKLSLARWNRGGKVAARP